MAQVPRRQVGADGALAHPAAVAGGGAGFSTGMAAEVSDVTGGMDGKVPPARPRARAPARPRARTQRRASLPAAAPRADGQRPPEQLAAAVGVVMEGTDVLIVQVSCFTPQRLFCFVLQRLSSSSRPSQGTSARVCAPERRRAARVHAQVDSEHATNAMHGVTPRVCTRVTAAPPPAP